MIMWKQVVKQQNTHEWHIINYFENRSVNKFVGMQLFEFEFEIFDVESWILTL